MTSDRDFTEENYKRLLEIAMAGYRFCDYLDTADEPLVVWRHDIDYSPNRALALARLEAGCGQKCIYHVMLTSRYYSIMERETLALIQEIAALGHQIGLHFDIEILNQVHSLNEDSVRKRIRFEKDVMHDLLGIEPRSMSFHNTILNMDRITSSVMVEDMINVNSPEIFQSYRYISDSNGIWRKDRLEDVLRSGQEKRLHVLTHPVWWTPEIMTPAQRLRRAIEGRARAGLQMYFDLMKQDGRFDEILEISGFNAKHSP